MCTKLLGRFFVRIGDMFFEATAVLMAEIFKLVTCLFLVFNDEGRDSKKYFNSLYQTIWVDKIDTLKVTLLLIKRLYTC